MSKTLDDIWGNKKISFFNKAARTGGAILNWANPFISDSERQQSYVAYNPNLRAYSDNPSGGGGSTESNYSPQANPGLKNLANSVFGISNDSHFSASNPSASRQPSSQPPEASSLSSSRGQSGGSSMTYDPKAVAWLDQQLARFPGLYRNIENNRQNRLKRNAEDYELYRQDTEDQYNQAKRNFEFERSQRLKTREKRLAGNDASYKNQMDQWQRYLGMMGVGRSSTAQVTVPDALSREATQAKDQIEDENALNATKSQLSWDETERRRSRTLADLINNKNRADDETNAQFDGLVAGQKEKEAQLQRERGQAQGRTIGSILNSTQPLVNEAELRFIISV